MVLIKATLEEQLKTAFQNEDWDKAAGAIASSIDSYIKSATVTIPAGIPVSTTGSPAAQTGASTAPAIGSIS